MIFENELYIPNINEIRAITAQSKNNVNSNNKEEQTTIEYITDLLCEYLVAWIRKGAERGCHTIQLFETSTFFNLINEFDISDENMTKIMDNTATIFKSYGYEVIVKMCGYLNEDNNLSKTTYKMQISWKEDIDNEEKNTI